MAANIEEWRLINQFKEGLEHGLTEEQAGQAWWEYGIRHTVYREGLYPQTKPPVSFAFRSATAVPGPSARVHSYPNVHPAEDYIPVSSPREPLSIERTTPTPVYYRPSPSDWPESSPRGETVSAPTESSEPELGRTHWLSDFPRRKGKRW